MTILHDAVSSRPGLVGQPVKRREDSRLLTGRGRFVDDVHLPGTLHPERVWSLIHKRT